MKYSVTILLVAASDINEAMSFINRCLCKNLSTSVSIIDYVIVVIVHFPHRLTVIIQILGILSASYKPLLFCSYFKLFSLLTWGKNKPGKESHSTGNLS